MALTNAYCTVAEFRDFSRIPDSDDDLTIHEYVINAAARTIDRYTGRPHGFWQDGSVTTREYHADSSTCVQVDDISTTTGLIVKTDTADAGTFSTTLTITTDFVLYPLNAADETPVRPFDEIRIVSGANYSFPTSSRPGVQVTAKFGWPAVPDDIRLANIFQAQMLYGAAANRGGLGGDGFPTPRYMHPQAQVLLNAYVKAPR